MNTPALTATFQPQQWIGDNAIDCAPSFTFDAGTALLALTASQARYVVEQASQTSGRVLDALAMAANLVGEGDGQHNGPFYVEVEAEDLAAFLDRVGIADPARLTDADLARARERYAALPPD